MNIEEYLENVASEVLLDDSPNLASAKVYDEIASINEAMDNLKRIKSIMKIKLMVIKHLSRHGSIEV